jgi:sec-independent protein translocase protein TatA
MFESPWHWAVVIVVALILFFGWKQLPDMARSMGRSLRVFKTEMKGMSADDDARRKAEDARADTVRTEPPALEAPKAVPPAAPRPRPTPNGAARTERPAGDAR